MIDVPALPIELDETANLGRLLMGGDRSSSAFSLFVDRSLMFCSQPLNLDQNTLVGLFYERLRGADEVVTALLIGVAISQQGVPFEHGLLVQLGLRMFPSFYDAPLGRVPMPGPDERSVGNHQVTLTGLEIDDERLAFAHLFSPDWGQNGLGSLPVEYLIEYGFEATVVRLHGGPAPAEIEDNTKESVASAATDSALDFESLDLAELNKTRLRRLEREYPDGSGESPWALGHLDDDVIWAGRRLIGAASGDLWIQAAVLLRGIIERPLLVGWMFGRVLTDGLMDIEEFFVWPTYRGRGIGTALAGRTLLYAAATQVYRVRWLEREADALTNATVRIHVPSWLAAAGWSQCDDAIGWGASRMSSEMDLKSLIARLGEMHSPGGVHLLRIDGAITVADHPTSPSYGLVIA